MKITRPSIRAALFVPLLSLGLLVPSLGPSQTQAGALPAPCGLADDLDPAVALEGQVLILSAMASADVDPVPSSPRRPSVGVGVPAAAPPPPGEVRAPSAPGADLRPPPPALLNAEPIQAARQLHASLTDKQKSDLQGVLTKHRTELQRVRGRAPGVTTDGGGTRAAQGGREGGLRVDSADAQRIGERIDQDLESILTPQQRALLQKSRPKRLRSELPLPAAPSMFAAPAMVGC